jgi:hypothetical protein
MISQMAQRVVGAISIAPSIFLEGAATSVARTAAVRPFCGWNVTCWRKHFPNSDRCDIDVAEYLRISDPSCGLRFACPSFSENEVTR